jgi:hypothetical protein
MKTVIIDMDIPQNGPMVMNCPICGGDDLVVHAIGIHNPNDLMYDICLDPLRVTTDGGSGSEPFVTLHIDCRDCEREDGIYLHFTLQDGRTRVQWDI